MIISIDSSTFGFALHLAWPLGEGSASPGPWVCALPRPTSEGGLRLARHRGHELRCNTSVLSMH